MNAEKLCEWRPHEGSVNVPSLGPHQQCQLFFRSEQQMTAPGVYHDVIKNEIFWQVFTCQLQEHSMIIKVIYNAKCSIHRYIDTILTPYLTDILAVCV